MIKLFLFLNKNLELLVEAVFRPGGSVFIPDQLLRLDQLADALDLPRAALADVPPARPARGRYAALYSLSAACRHLNSRGIAFGRVLVAPAD